MWEISIPGFLHFSPEHSCDTAETCFSSWWLGGCNWQGGLCSVYNVPFKAARERFRVHGNHTFPWVFNNGTREIYLAMTRNGSFFFRVCRKRAGIHEWSDQIWGRFNENSKERSRLPSVSRCVGMDDWGTDSRDEVLGSNAECQLSVIRRCVVKTEDSNALLF